MNNFITIINSNMVLYCSFGVYPSYVVGILNFVNKNHFFLLHSGKLNYAMLKNTSSVKSALSSCIQTTV